MSGFVSSAVSGKKIAPKGGAGRRRNLPTAPKPTTAASSTSLQSEAHSLVSKTLPIDHVSAQLPTPAATQAPNSSNNEQPTAIEESHRHDQHNELEEARVTESVSTVVNSTPNISLSSSTHPPEPDLSHGQSSQNAHELELSSVARSDLSNVEATANQSNLADAVQSLENVTIPIEIPESIPRSEEATPQTQAHNTRKRKSDIKEGPKPRKSARRAVQSHTNEEDGSLQQEEPEREQTTDQNCAPQKKRGRRKKAVAQADGQEDDNAPSDPELHEINPAELSMFQLSHHAHYGQVSEREKKMAKIDWKEVARKRREAAEKILEGGAAKGEKADATETTEQSNKEDAAAEAENAENGGGSPAQNAENESSAPVVSTGGLRFRMVNGQIVEDEETLAIDRNADAEANVLNNEPVEEENDLTARVNRSTWVNNRRRDTADRVPMWKSKSNPWSEEETEKFYEALRMFGTDFTIISKMFPPKTRRQIKTKYTREDRLDPVRVTNALMGKETKRMDIEHYARESGRDVSVYTKYDSYEHADEVIRESLKEKQEMVEQAMREEVENARQETIQREQRKAAAENRKNHRRGRKGRVGVGTLGGGQGGDG